MTVIMDYGESRHIKLMIHNCRGDEFEIVRAEYEFAMKGAEIPETSGLASKTARNIYSESDLPYRGRNAD